MGDAADMTLDMLGGLWDDAEYGELSASPKFFITAHKYFKKKAKGQWYLTGKDADLVCHEVERARLKVRSNR